MIEINVSLGVDQHLLQLTGNVSSD